MKSSLTFATAATMLFTSEAFMPSAISSRQSLALKTSADSNAVQEALHASKTFGPTSREARVAWDIVEEIRASDNSSTLKADENIDLDNKEMYSRFLELRKLGSLQRDHVESIKHVTDRIRAVKVNGPKLSHSLDEQNPILGHALSEAKMMTEKHGALSSEAKLAWETVEDIASDDMSEAMKGAIDSGEECLVEMLDACEALGELNKALFSN